jgi:hypothetical protein
MEARHRCRDKAAPRVEARNPVGPESQDFANLIVSTKAEELPSQTGLVIGRAVRDAVIGTPRSQQGWYQPTACVNPKN